MKKLPEGEAKRRHEERNRLQNERVKGERRSARIDKGLPPVSTPEWRKEQMRNYQRERRAKEREINAEANTARRTAKKAATAARLLAKRLVNDKEKRRLAREAGKPDLRLKVYRPKPIIKAKPVKIPKVRSRVKSSEEPKVIRIPQIDLSACIPLRLDAKTTIYVKQGSDTKAIIQRFQNRNN